MFGVTFGRPRRLRLGHPARAQLRHASSRPTRASNSSARPSSIARSRTTRRRHADPHPAELPFALTNLIMSSLHACFVPYFVGTFIGIALAAYRGVSRCRYRRDRRAKSAGGRCIGISVAVGIAVFYFIYRLFSRWVKERLAQTAARDDEPRISPDSRVNREWHRWYPTLGSGFRPSIPSEEIPMPDRCPSCLVLCGLLVQDIAAAAGNPSSLPSSSPVPPASSRSTSGSTA